MEAGVRPKVHTGDGWEIHAGRWQACLPLLSGRIPDVHIGDAPFDLETHEGHELDARDREAVAFPPADPTEVVKLLEYCKRWTITFCSLEQLGDYRKAAGGGRKQGGDYVRSGAWYKTNPAPQISGDRPAQWGEGIAIMHPRGGQMQWNGGGHSGIWVGPSARGEERLVQTPKPIWLMVKLVEAFSNPGETVLDAYAGSATTGVACLRLGRYFIGCEVDPATAEIAVNRLRAEQYGLSLQATQEDFNGQRSVFDLFKESNA